MAASRLDLMLEESALVSTVGFPSAIARSVLAAISGVLARLTS
jgi:hypothetical protein